LFVEFYHAFWRGDLTAAQAVQARIQHVRRALKDGGDLSLFKAVLTHRGMPAGGVRAPLLNASNEAIGAAIRSLLDAGIALTSVNV